MGVFFLHNKNKTESTLRSGVETVDGERTHTNRGQKWVGTLDGHCINHRESAHTNKMMTGIGKPELPSMKIRKSP